MTRVFLLSALIVFFSCNNPDTKVPDDGPGPSSTKILSHSIVATFPHDTSSFTEGLLIYNGDLYEGTGNYTRSHLIKTNLKTGVAEKKIPLPDSIFGEGITILRDTLYQLSWKEHQVFVYKLPQLDLVKKFTLDTEGWGMTTDGSSLIVSDGSSNLYYYDPATFKLLRSQSVMESGTLTYNLNELEFVDGFILANQWQQPYILKIDPASGTVVAKADLTNVWERVKKIYPKADVLNGIAYDSLSKKTYVTGKNWPELYQVEFSK